MSEKTYYYIMGFIHGMAWVLAITAVWLIS